MELILNRSCHLLFWTIFLFLWPPLAMANCDGPYKGQKISAEQLQHIAAQHKIWFKEMGKTSNIHDERRANLCGAQLQNMSLNNMDLSRADLMEANLTGAKLKRTKLYRASLDKAILNEANLLKADLTEAYLFNVEMKRAKLTETILVNALLDGSNLNESNLNGANLTKARLDGVNLSETILQYANLTNASLRNANLSYADLTLTILTGSVLYKANLKKVIYFPKFGKLPDITTLLFAENFEDMKYHDPIVGAPALRELRAAYRKAGMRPRERLITYMIKDAEEQTNWEKGGWKRGYQLKPIQFANSKG